MARAGPEKQIPIINVIREAMRRALEVGLALTLLALTSDVLAFQTRPTSRVQKLGPFMLGSVPSQRVTVIANYGRTTGEPIEDTVTSWTIQDATGATLFREVFDYAKQETANVNTIQRAVVLVGGARRFLVVEMTQEPTGPGEAQGYVLFGFDRTGKLRRLARVTNDGPSILKPSGPGGEMPLANGRYFDIGHWNGWFTVISRYEYDEAREQFVSHNRCAPVRDATFGPEMLQERIAARDNVIALHRAMDPRSPAERIAVTATTNVQILQTCFVPASSPPGDEQKTYFLQIRINGKEGWIVEEDFFRIGLRQAG